MTDNPEAFSRILIDKELEYSGWDLEDSHQIRFEYHMHNRWADYLLMDKIGGVLCVLETKHDEAWHNYDQASRELEKKKDELLDDISKRLEQNMENERLFVVRWSLK